MAIKGLSPAASTAVRNKTLQNESRGNYSQPGNQFGFIGGYQFGTAALQDVGLVRPGTFDPKLSISQNNAKLSDPNNWTISGGKQAFLSNPQLQDRAFDQYATRNINTLTRLGVIGPNTPEADIAGYAMASHIGGAGGARALANGEIRADANGTTTARYFRDGKTAALQSQQSPGAVTDDSLSQLPIERVSTAKVQSVRTPQLEAAETYRTTVGSQQNLMLAEQDSWFASTNGKGVPGQTAEPKPNPLSSFVSFSYLITLGCLPIEQLDVMDGYGSIILQSANGLPNNRQQIASGSWDFYINQLDIESLIGYERNSKGTNVTRIDFEVIEPYSLGLFLESLQAAALVVGYKNYAEAPFCLTIEFVGWDENGNATQLKDVRRIALHFTNIEMDISTKGSRYKIQAIPWSEYGLTDQFAKFQSDINFYCDAQGPFTVKDLLKTAQVSLENAVNLRFKELQSKLNPPLTPDSIKIEFEGTAEAEIGDSLVSFDLQKGGVAGILNPSDVYENNTVNRKKVTHNPNSKGFTFSQGTTIVTAITEVLLQSEYCTNNIKSKAEKPTGMIDWFRIETEVRNNGKEDGRGRPAREITFKIVKYKVHSSKITHPSAKPDYNSLLSNVVKVYDYIYTGKNTEVLNFNINIKYGFFTTVFADQNKLESRNLYRDQIQGAGREENKNDYSATNPAASSDADTALPQAQTGQILDRRNDPGGTDAVDPLRLLSKTFHEALLNSPEEMVIAEIEVMGDPYYLIASGTGNYSSSRYQGDNETPTGEIDYQSGEVDVLVNFRTPVDINESTGLVDFGSTEVAQGFSGLYHVIRVENKFSQGKFTQVLHAVRRQKQAKGGKSLKQFSPTESASPLREPKPALPDSNTPVDRNTLGTTGADTVGASEG
jgi:hypothetical protein